MAVLVMANPPGTKALASGRERLARATVPAAVLIYAQPLYATSGQAEALARGFCGDLRDAIWLFVASGRAASDHHPVVADHRTRLMRCNMLRAWCRSAANRSF
jgi:hypothetical protein